MSSAPTVNVELCSADTSVHTGARVRTWPRVKLPSRFTLSQWMTAAALPVIVAALVLHAVELYGPLANSVPTDNSEGPRAMTAQEERALLTAGEFVLGAYSGVSYTHASDVRVQRQDGSELTLRSVEWDGQPFRNPIYYGVRIAGWAKGLPFGAMLDFTHAKALSRLDSVTDVERRGATESTSTVTRERIGDIFDKLEFSHGHNMLLANGLYRLPLGSARLSPYIGIGAGVSLPHVEIRETGAESDRTYGYQITGLSLQGLFGFEVRLVHSSVFVEYKLSFSPYRPTLTDSKGGRLATDLLTHHLIGGMSMRTSRVN